ncbi:MAG: TIGR04283 family arsenosugar biosynthesis glycosyltransferase [Thermoplasmatota archaeon]
MKYRLSIIIPVLQEAENINGLIDHIRSLPGGREAEIIVADGEPDCGTLRAVVDRRVKKVRSKPGRGMQMNRGASMARGDVLLFLHADTRLPGNGIGAIKSALADDDISGGAFTLDFDDVSPVIRMLLPFHNLMRKLSRTPLGDQGIFIRRSAFRRIGGYSDIRLFEDMDLMKRIRKAGLRIRILPEKAVTSGRRFNEGISFLVLMRNIVLVLLYHIGVDPDRLAGCYDRKK